MSTTTSKLALTKPGYRDARWDLPINANFEILDDVHGTVIAVDKILETTANAVDVFIYDTSKDSDGGAWRKRCQDLSWYNELGEFPAIVLIVAETNKTTLYDLTNPSVPVWIVFDGSVANNMLIPLGASTVSNKVSMYNSVLSNASNTGAAGALATVDFLNDSGFSHRQTGMSAYNGPYNGNISQRNDTLAYTHDEIAIVNQVCNDVAMTVLPNAPIDQVTELSITTKLVPTAAGASWIKDDETIVDATGAINLIAADINFSGLSVMASSSTVYVFNSVPDSDVALTSADYITSPVGTITSVKLDGSNVIIGTSEGFIETAYNMISPNDSMAYQTTDAFFSGWMQGDIELSLSGENLTDKSINGVTVTDNGTATFADVGANTDLQATTANGGTITAPVPTEQICYGWEKISDEWLFREEIGDFVGVSESGGTLTIADGTIFTLIRYTSGAPNSTQLSEIEKQEKKLFEEDAKYLLPSDSVQALDFDNYDNTLVIGTDLGTVRFKDLRKIEDLISVEDQTNQDIVAVTANDGHIGLVTTAETGVIVPTLNIRENEAEVRGRINTLIEEAGLEELLRLTNCFNGVKIDIKDIRVDGSNVHIDFERDGGGDIPFKYGDIWYTLDCTNGDGPDGIATVILEQGTDEEPLFQFIHMFYSESSQKVEVATTQIIPDDGKFGPVCYALCFTSTKVAASGMAYIHRITDIVSDDVRGALSYGREKLRLGAGGNNRIVGCDVELAITTNASARDNIYVTSLPGTFYQLHRHDWAGYYSGDYGIRALSQLIGECTIPNYGMITDLGTIAEDAEGVAITDGDSIYVDIIGIGTSCSCQRLAFAISPRSYATAQDCIDAAKLRIALPYPRDIRHLCFTLSRMVLTYSSANGGTWSNALSATALVWQSDVISTTTPSYPYYPNGAAEYIGPTLYHAGAVSIRVHFRDFDTERNYDYVRLRNAGGTNIFSYHGSLGAFTSANMVGDTIRPYFQSDGSVTRKGAYIDRFEYQVEVSTGGGEIIDMR